MSRNTKLTKGHLRDLETKGLPEDSLNVVREMAAEGCREPAIRRALGLTYPQWRALKKDTADGDLSPLAQALEEGRAEGAGEVIAFMRAKMLEGDTRAAEWLGDRLYKIGREDGSQEDAPRVLIQINAALSPDDYGRIIDVNRDRV
ncbi:hypothetical protein MQE22_04155 [Acidithiobacillus sp. YTS05]|nr:hypothetical protein MQE22_04155 [Acidithiobacillus sp. YTS05]